MSFNSPKIKRNCLERALFDALLAFGALRNVQKRTILHLNRRSD